MVDDATRNSETTSSNSQNSNSSIRRRILPLIYDGASILQEVHVVSPHGETRPRSGSDSSSSSPTSTIDVPQHSSSSLMLMASFTRSPNLRGKGGKKFDKLTLSDCTSPVLTILKEEPASASRTSSLATCLEFQRNQRNAALREFRNNSRSFRRSYSLESRPMTPPPKEDESSSSSSRRSIFDTFWKSEKSFGSHHPPPSAHMDGDDLSSAAAAAAEDRRLHLAQPWLPAVPTPLVRMHSHCGVYPLVKPQSILRKTKSLTDRSRGKSRRRTDSIRNPGRGSAVSFNRAQSMRIRSVPFSPQEHPATVHFDPRVVVTEFADAEPRFWYNEQELQTFQAETSHLVQEYLHHHPHLIPMYSQPVRNTVTGTMRKRSLFTLGIFRQEHQTDDDGDTTTTEASVQRIRIVDPHPATLSLLRRSFVSLFPAAYIDCSCGDADNKDDQGSATKQHQSSWDILVLDGSVLCKTGGDPPVQTTTRNTLVIGLRHRANTAWTTEGVVDIAWDKPMPSINAELRQSLLRSLGDKRRRNVPC